MICLHVAYPFTTCFRVDKNIIMELLVYLDLSGTFGFIWYSRENYLSITPQRSYFMTDYKEANRIYKKFRHSNSRSKYSIIHSCSSNLRKFQRYSQEERKDSVDAFTSKELIRERNEGTHEESKRSGDTVTTLLDYLPDEVKERYRTADNPNNSEKIERKRENHHYFLYSGEEESKWLRDLKKIVTDRENYPEIWYGYTLLFRKAKKNGIINRRNIEKWNELVESYAKQYSKFTIHFIAERIKDTYVEAERHLEEHLNSLVRFGNREREYARKIFDLLAKLKGLSEALRKKTLNRYWALHENHL